MQFPMIDGYIEKLRPHVVSTGEIARAYCERIISRLDRIADAVEQEEWQESRYYPSITFAGPLELPFEDIGVGEVWEIEAVRANAAALVIIRQDGQDRWTKVFSGADTVGGSGVILTGPGQVTVAASAACVVGLQVKRKRHAPGKLTRTAGVREPAPEYRGYGAETVSRHNGAGVVAVPR